MKTSASGFSLIEVLIFITIFGFFFVTATAVVIGTLRDLRVNENKLRASQYANTLMEWLRGEREKNWGGSEYSGVGTATFTGKVSKNGTASTKYCFNQLDITGWPTQSSGGSDSDPCAGAYTLAGFFKRSVEFNSILTSGIIEQVTVKVTVEWRELGNTYTSQLNTVFKINE